MVGRGIGIGFGVFAVLFALSYLTPLRKPALAGLGRDYPALQYRLQAERDTLDALQMRASNGLLSPAEQASLERVRRDYVLTRERLDDWGRMNARLTLFGFLDWIAELLPWLVAFGLALPVLGGLIGAQVSKRGRPAPVPTGMPASVPLDRPHPVPPPLAQAPKPAAPAPAPSPAPVPGAPRHAYVHPAILAAKEGGTSAPVPASAPIAPMAPPAPAPLRPTPSGPAPGTPVRIPLPGSPVIMPPGVVSPATPPMEPSSKPAEDWGFRHPPKPLENRPRPRMPPVRSPHASDLDADAGARDPDEASGV
jgi:hypothetical protein